MAMDFIADFALRHRKLLYVRTSSYTFPLRFQEYKNNSAAHGLRVKPAAWKRGNL
jgi:hypothetical protein